MQVMQATAWYPPYSGGGTEVYVESLVRELHRLGTQTTVLTPRLDKAEPEYVHDGTKVITYPVGESTGLDEFRGDKFHVGFEEFLSQLRAFPGSIYHQHSWTRGCGLKHLQAAKSLGLRTIVTVHVPGVPCMRGTMMFHGERACDGVIAGQKCGRCFLQAKGLPSALASAVSSVPLSASRLFSHFPGPVMTALAARHLCELRLTEVRGMFSTADRIVAVCDWLADALHANGAPSEKLFRSRQGLSPDLAERLSRSALVPRGDGRLRLLFLGRMDPMKGVDVIVKAVRELPKNADVTLTIRAIEAAFDNRSYGDEIAALAAQDGRISIEHPVPRSELPDLMSSHDVLCIPSRSLETGPLVALEARAAGLHVLGTDVGGVAELVRSGDDGTLVKGWDEQHWSAAVLTLLAKKRAGLLGSGASQPRTMTQVALETIELYRGLA